MKTYDFKQAVAAVAHALRAMRMEIRKGRVSDYRYANLGDELSTALRGEHRAGMSAATWFGNLCARWNVSAAGDSDNNSAPLRVRTADGPVRWDVALAPVRRTHLERIVGEYGALLATFAMAAPSDSDDLVLEAIDAPDEVPDPWVYEAPEGAIYPQRHHAVWTCASPLAHGADEKDGNVQRFRVEARFDELTGKVSDIPFVSGNSIRGLMRDLLMTDEARRVGVRAEEMRPVVAHARLSGGQIASGADAAGVLRPLRKRWRSISPATDLLGGILEETQPLAGWLRCFDLVPVCRETAARVARVVSPGVDPRELAPRLPCAADLFETRQLVRSSHRELEGSEEHGGQMLARMEVIRAGTRWVHAVALTGQLGDVPDVVRAALVHGLSLLRENGTVGAGAARGLSDVEIGDYAPELGTADAYLEHLEKNREALRDLLLSRGEDAPPSKGGKGGKKLGTTKAVEPKAPGAPGADGALF